MNSDSSSAISTKTHWIVNGVVALLGLILSLVIYFNPNERCYTGLAVWDCDAADILAIQIIALYIVAYVLSSTLLRKLYSFLNWGNDKPWLRGASIYLPSFILAMFLTLLLGGLTVYVSSIF